MIGYTEADWQEAELLDYGADLDSWREIITLTTGPVLELGCGVGRLARALSIPSRSFVGIDRDPAMVTRFNEALATPNCRAFELAVERMDRLRAYSEVDGSLFGLIMAPMLLIQVVDGADSRSAVLSSASRMLQPDGVLALSVNFDLPDSDRSLAPVGQPAPPAPGSLVVEPRELRSQLEGVVIEKVRSVVGGTHQEEVVTDFLHRLSPTDLEKQLNRADLTPFIRFTVPGDRSSQGSSIVLARLSGP